MARTDAWAVGGTSWFYPTQTVAYHWNGKTWSQVPTPTPGGSAWFNAVAATSPTQRLGGRLIGGGPGDRLRSSADRALERQGLAAAVLQPAQEQWRVHGVAATSASNAWAVGETNNGGRTAR